MEKIIVSLVLSYVILIHLPFELKLSLGFLLGIDAWRESIQEAFIFLMMF